MAGSKEQGMHQAAMGRLAKAHATIVPHIPVLPQIPQKIRLTQSYKVDQIQRVINPSTDFSLGRIVMWRFAINIVYPSGKGGDR